VLGTQRTEREVGFLFSAFPFDKWTSVHLYLEEVDKCPPEGGDRMDAHALFPPIVHFYRTRHRMPSLRELAPLYGFRSQNAADKAVTKLLAAGLVAKDRTGRLLPTHHFSPLRVLGSVEAGFPSPAEEELGDTMDLEEFLIRNKEATYMLKVTGDSMIDAGLLP